MVAAGASIFVGRITTGFIFGTGTAVATGAFDVAGRQVACGIRIIRAEVAAFLIQSVAAFAFALLVAAGAALVISIGADTAAMPVAIIRAGSAAAGAFRANGINIAFFSAALGRIQFPIFWSAG